MKAYLSGILAALVALGAALIYAKGRKDANADRDADSLKAGRHAKDNRYELENADDQYIVDILTGKLR